MFSGYFKKARRLSHPLGLNNAGLIFSVRVSEVVKWDPSTPPREQCESATTQQRCGRYVG